MTIREPRTQEPNVEQSSHSIELNIPHNVWIQIPEQFRNSKEDLIDYLNNATQIGILAMANASLSLDTSELERMVEHTAEQTLSQQQEINKNLEAFVESNLTGNDSILARRMQETLGSDGLLERLLKSVTNNLTDPEQANSIPAKTGQVLLDQATQVMTILSQATDITDEKTNLGKFVREQRERVGEIRTMVAQTMTEMGEQLDARMKRIEDALNVDETLQAKEQEIEELHEKSTGKGIHFENDSVDALQDIAGLFGDRVEHTGGEGEGASRSKVGDIVLVINHTGLPPLRVAIEAKAGKIPRKELLRQIREGVKNRSALCGIGLMERKHMGVRSFVVEKEDENYLVGVDWKNDDFLALEVIYRTLRIQLVNEQLHAQGEIEVDVDALRKSLAQIKTDLGDFQAMKGNASNAMSVIQNLKDQIEILERKLKRELKDAEALLE
tara:strand:+ start:474 stop:1799 length:1326 start_codon:yes stop_codon:yes gene_type:complete